MCRVCVYEKRKRENSTGRRRKRSGMEQETTLDTPMDAAVGFPVAMMKPGGLVEICPLIQFWYSDTRAYTPGVSANAHSMPKLTTPASTQREPFL